MELSTGDNPRKKFVLKTIKIYLSLVRMVISDIFSSSFLFSISIIIILIGGIFAYVSYRMSEQDHKLTSMVNLVSILVQDLQFVKSKLNKTNNDNDDNDNDNDDHDPSNIKYPSDMMGGELISVSDCDNNEEDEEEQDDDQEDDEDEDDEYEDEKELDIGDEETDIGDEEIDINANDTIKLLNLSLVNNDNIDIDISEHNENNDNNDDINISEHNENTTKTIHLDDIGLSEDIVDEKLELNDDIIKSIYDIEDLNKTDYKKMSLNKLRELVVSRGLVTDASKLKKHDILKMLGEE
jgi:hypothetical protein